ncbi:hypothetical protein [Mucilaginibacter pedocola]|uniref:Uncharacterized protein n=1 Tax=Mucilaginibacter pedocola TaxID=1792845 RepID=A0A1S9PFH7_9SPHI|nr:hypothetical protein [Mucilaginibacter pedocola]OOQ59714.1 hypothetical protein BC343_05990 [Mucilaginibacter pedocola]
MIAALYQKHIYVRIAMGMLLILLIALKAAAPVFVSLRSVGKETSSATENDDEGEKKAENNSSIEKEKEFTDAATLQSTHLFWYTQVIHFTGYYNNYQTTHFLKITSPPPDFYLHPIC